MQSTTNPETDQAAAVEPPLRHAVPWRVIAVEALRNYRLRVTFVGGTTGEVDLSELLEAGATPGPVFEPLRDKAFFERADVVHGAVQWPNGADLAPDAMYDEIKTHGCWIVRR
jgi:Protein of unknown function (DUF2442)